ncbi:hypothetical protein [Nocardioides aurantiacus]|uniref:hypothetical protein n=1 Tax=Nocardioides aurantiacus TaxID=86796 RepID=UPI00403F4426
MQLPPFHPNRPDLVRPVRVDPAGIGGPTPKQARGPGWRRTTRGFYVPADVARSAEQRIVEAAATLPGDGAITGWAALRWWGARWSDGLGADGLAERPVVLASCDQDLRPQPGTALSQERLAPSEIVVHHGLRVVIPVRAVFFEMRYAAAVREAVAHLDMAAYDDLVSRDEAWRYALAHPGWTGVPQAREAVVLADENTWSPRETWLRLLWQLDAGLPPVLTNRPIFDLGGHHVATADLIEPEAGLVVEYDGDLHLSRHRRRHDLAREHELRQHGLEHVVVVAGDAADVPRLVDRLVATHRRALATPRPRSWTLDPPRWWQPSVTVEQRRRLTGRPLAAVRDLRRRTAS